MTLDELDNLLAKWQKDIQAVTLNLVAYEDSSSYKTIKTILPSLEGETKKIIEPAISALELVWEHFGKLNEVIKEAASLRQNMPLVFGRADRIKQIEQLLTGPSVCFQIKEISLEERGLTGASHLSKMTTPPDIFASMQSRFSDATKNISRYEKAYQELSQKLDAVESDLHVKFGGDDGQTSAAKNMLHTDPISGLEALKKAKKPVRKSVVEAPLEAVVGNAGGSLYAFLSEGTKKKEEPAQVVTKIVQSLDTTVETCKIASLLANSNPSGANLPSSSVEQLITNSDNNISKEQPSPNLESLFNGGECNTTQPPPAISTKPANKSLEDLFS